MSNTPPKGRRITVHPSNVKSSTSFKSYDFHDDISSASDAAVAPSTPETLTPQQRPNAVVLPHIRVSSSWQPLLLPRAPQRLSGGLPGASPLCHSLGQAPATTAPTVVAPALPSVRGTEAVALGSTPVLPHGASFALSWRILCSS